jgi:hypothetical protein
VNEPFWAWWSAHAAELAEAIDSGRGVSDDQAEALRLQVEAIDERLDWELAPGAGARHALVVTSGGNPELRATAERWRRSAPPADELWEFHATRQPSYDDLGTTLALDGHRVDLTELEATVEIDEGRSEADVTVHHPVFADVPESTQHGVALLALDWLLGEEGVERWVGAIDVAVERPAGARAFRTIVDAVHELETAHRPGEWRLLEATDDDGLPVLVTAALPLKPVEHPLLDTHVTITRAYEGREDGLPEQAELEELHALADALEAQLSGDAYLAAHVTHAGERTFHVYVDGAAGDAGKLAAWASDHDAAVDVQHDPAWDAVRPFR